AFDSKLFRVLHSNHKAAMALVGNPRGWNEAAFRNRFSPTNGIARSRPGIDRLTEIHLDGPPMRNRLLKRKPPSLVRGAIASLRRAYPPFGRKTSQNTP